VPLLRIAVPFLLILISAAWVTFGIDLVSAGDALLQARWSMSVPMVACYLAAHLARSHRLSVLLSGRARFLPLFRVNAIGYMAISIMPLRLGELVRPHLLWQQHGLPLPLCIGAVAVERLLDIGALLVVLLVGMLASGVFWSADLQQTGWKLGAVLFAGVALLSAAWLVARRLGSGATRRWLSTRAAKLAVAFREGAGGLLRQPNALIYALADTALVYAFSIAATGCVLRAFYGVPRDPATSALLLSFTTIGMSAAPTPGSLGTFEASGLAALLLLGVDRTLAATVSLTLHLAQLGFSLGLGSLAMLAEGVRFGDLARMGKERGH
jgi:hypothetical protein